MNNFELLNEFNLLYNNVMSNGAPGFNEYEISIFLTEAQESLVKELYSGKNVFRTSFESSEESNRSLSNLLRTYSTTEEFSPKYPGDIRKGLSVNSYFFQLPQDVWYIVREQIKISPLENLCDTDEPIDVIPVTHDDFARIRRNPFRKEGTRRALRLSLDKNIVEIISKYNIHSYLLRYLVQPSPIVLINLKDEDPTLSINGVNTYTECQLHESLQREIVARAVMIATASYKQ